MINEEILRIQTLMNINENIDVKLRRRHNQIKNIVDSVLYDSEEDAIQGLVDSFDDEFDFADNIIELVIEMLSMSDPHDWLSNDDDYFELKDYIRDEFGIEVIEYYYNNR
jgi:hypothetical protein